MAVPDTGFSRESEVKLSKALTKTIRVLRDFDSHQPVLHHDRLEICMPQGFYRYSGGESAQYQQWDSIDIRMVYYYVELRFSINLAATSDATSFEIIKHLERLDECFFEYRVLKGVSLTIQDAKRLLLFCKITFGASIST